MVILSDEEINILRKYASDDFVWQYDTKNNPGWKNDVSYTWTKGFHLICDLQEDTFLKLLHGLVDKNIIVINNNTFWLTEYGKKMFELNKLHHKLKS